MPQSKLGLRNYLSNIYVTTGTTITASLGGAKMLSNHLPKCSRKMASTMAIGAGVALLGTIGMYVLKPKTKKKYNVDGEEILTTTNSLGRLISFGTMIVGNAMMIAPLFSIYRFSPDVLLIGSVASASIFIGNTLFARFVNGPLLIYPFTPIFGTIHGVVWMSIMSGTSIWFLDSYQLYYAMLRFDTYYGIMFFTMLSFYDTHRAIKQYQLGKADHLEHGSILGLDFLNTFVRFTGLIRPRNRKRNRFNKFNNDDDDN